MLTFVELFVIIVLQMEVQLMLNAYKVLGVPEGTSKDECRKAYRKLCIKHHPDNGGDPAKFSEITKAWQLIESGKTAQMVSSIVRNGLRHKSMFDFELC